MHDQKCYTNIKYVFSFITTRLIDMTEDQIYLSFRYRFIWFIYSFFSAADSVNLNPVVCPAI